MPPTCIELTLIIPQTCQVTTIILNLQRRKHDQMKKIKDLEFVFPTDHLSTIVSVRF